MLPVVASPVVLVMPASVVAVFVLSVLDMPPTEPSVLVTC